MDIRLLPSEGRFEAAFRAANVPPGRLEIELYDREGQPWLIHPSWGSDPNTPAILTAENVIPGIVDRAANLRSQAFWRAEHPKPGPDIRLRAYLDWSKEQRERLGYAIVRVAS
jgi:hypothetical protein